MTGHQRWIGLVLLALSPLWFVGIVHRSLWTPDEPREADIAWNMSLQSDRTLPQLAGTPFLEKPPLSYWLSAAAIRVFGNSPAAARAPNLLYAAITVLAIGLLASVMGGTAAAVVAALAAGSMLTALRVSVWLAPDAAMMAGCAVALLGAFLGYRAPPGRRKLLGYLVMHAGAALGFMAKSAPGWIVPGLALLTLLVWERRWSELRRWELYAGLALQALIIGPWLLAVWLAPHGSESLRVLFWHNIVGRFASIEAPEALDYASQHRAWPGKYLLQLPTYLLPWTLLVGAALRRAWDRVRTADEEGSAWRFAVCASLPFLAILSLAATARDIYAAPTLLGFSLLLAVWARELSVAPSRLDAFALRATRVLLAVLIFAFTGALALLAAAASETSGTIGFLTVLLVVAVIALVGLRLAAREQARGHTSRTLAWLYATYAAAFSLSALAAFPVIDRWQDLPALAERIRADCAGVPLGLLNPDETTIAMLDLGARPPFTILRTPDDRAAESIAEWFRTQGGEARVLVKLPGRAPGEITELLDRFYQAKRHGEGIAGSLVAQRAARMLTRYELPHGRRYALLGPADAQNAASATR